MALPKLMLASSCPVGFAGSQEICGLVTILAIGTMVLSATEPKTGSDIQFVTRKLSNEDFLSRAPEHIVEKERDKERMFREKETKLKENIERISELC